MEPKVNESKLNELQQQIKEIRAFIKDADTGPKTGFMLVDSKGWAERLTWALDQLEYTLEEYEYLREDYEGVKTRWAVSLQQRESAS